MGFCRLRCPIRVSVQNGAADGAVFHDELLIVQVIADVFIAEAVDGIGQTGQNLFQPFVSRRLHDHFVETDIALGDLLFISELRAVLKSLTCLDKLLFLLLADPLACQPRTELIQGAAHFHDVLQILFRDPGDTGTAPGSNGHQTFQFQLADRLADRRPARPENLSQAHFRQPLTGMKLTGEDELAKGQKNSLTQRNGLLIILRRQRLGKNRQKLLLVVLLFFLLSHKKPPYRSFLAAGSTQESDI